MKIKPNTQKDYASLIEMSEDHDVIAEQEMSLDQLHFDIDNRVVRAKQKFSGFKMKVKKRNDLLEVSTLWKTPALPSAIVSMIVNIFYLGYIIIFEFDKISPKIPLIYNSIQNHWQQTDKSIIILSFLFIILLESLLIYLITKILPKDKRLGFVSSYIVTFLNILLLIYIIQIHYLILPKL